MGRWRVGLFAALAAVGVGLFGAPPRAARAQDEPLLSPGGASPGMAGRSEPEALSPSATAPGGEAPTLAPEVRAIVDRRQARQEACEHVEWPRWCHYCAQAEAALRLAPWALRPFDDQTGFLAVGQPHQYLPPQYAWATVAPVIPPRPTPGAPPRPPGPWRLPFFENDFRYLDNPESRTVDPFDVLKRIPGPVEGIVTDFGGEFRWQGRVEDNRRLLGERNDHNLFRQKLYIDTWFRDRFRLFGEVFWADSTRQVVPPVFFDVNRGDLLNAFGELRLYSRDDRTLSARFGERQQLLFGNHRLVSPLDWANSPRTFKYVANAVWRGPDWAIDGFWLRPNQILASEFDRAREAQQFFGLYAVYRGSPNRLYDFYYLGFLQEAAPGVAFNGESGDLAIHTLGTRWQVEDPDWPIRLEGEAAYQFGEHRGLPRNAGSIAAGFGRRFEDWPLKPELMFYIDYASGNRHPDAGSFATFNQLFPLGHKYFGYMDVVGRQNVIDPNVFLRFNFGTRAHLVFWYHNLQLASARDALYNAAGTPIRFDPTGAAGRFVGNELDVLATVYLNPHTDFQFGVSNFWAGTFVERTAPDPEAGGDGFFFYTQLTVRF